MEAICVQDAIKEFENGIIALDRVSYSFDYGKTYAVMGESGAGKTTLLSTMATFVPLSSGEIWINNNPVSALNPDEIALIRRYTIGFVFQSYYLNPKLSAIENVILPMVSGNKKYSDCLDDAARLMEKVGLSEKKEAYPSNMSGGEKQRVSIARALANDPRIILADEPTGNLDFDNEIKMFEILKGISEEGKCVIIVSHSKTVEEYADKILYMKHGQVVNG